MTKTKFGLIAAITCAIGYHYYELKQELFVSKWKNEIHQAEHRILRDELDELRSKKTYEQGVLDTAIRLNLNTEFADGVFQTVSAFKEQSYITGYHNAVEHTSAMSSFQHEQKKKELQLTRQLGYEDGFKDGRVDGYHQGAKDIATGTSHPDYTPSKNVNQKSE